MPEVRRTHWDAKIEKELLSFVGTEKFDPKNVEASFSQKKKLFSFLEDDIRLVVGLG